MLLNAFRHDETTTQQGIQKAFSTVYLAYSNKLKYYAKTKKILLVLYERFNSER